MRWTWLAPFAFALFCSSPTPATAGDVQRSVAARVAIATAKYWRPHYDRPDAWSAQLWAESRHRVDATSPVGACGIAQFMPATWAEQLRRAGLPATTSCRDLVAIEIGAFYMAQLRAYFPIAHDEEERQRMMRAAYNAGPGNIVKARRRCDAQTWFATKACLPDVTGRHALETIQYVARIDACIAKNANRRVEPLRARQDAC